MSHWNVAVAGGIPAQWQPVKVPRADPHADCTATITRQQDRIFELESQLQVRTDFAGASLTVREVEVISAVAQGLHTRAIAKHLGISPATVRNHLQSVYSKLDAHSRIQAVNTAREQGYLP